MDFAYQSPAFTIVYCFELILLFFTVFVKIAHFSLWHFRLTCQAAKEKHLRRDAFPVNHFSAFGFTSAVSSPSLTVKTIASSMPTLPDRISFAARVSTFF